jgi:hypothetical protein
LKTDNFIESKSHAQELSMREKWSNPVSLLKF